MIVERHIKKENGFYTIDFIKCYKGRKIHIFKSGIATLEEARRLEPLLLSRRINEYDSLRTLSSFDSFFEEYVCHRSTKVARSTLLSLESIRKIYFTEFENMSIEDIFDTRYLIKWYKKLNDKEGVTIKYKNRIIGEVREMSTFAFNLHYLDSETSLEAKGVLQYFKDNRTKKEKLIYTKEELDKFLSVINDQDDKDLFEVLSYLGLRISEFIGLTWDCYDEENKLIKVKQQIIYLQQNKPVLVKELKTKESYRVCKLSDHVNEILKRRKEKSHGKGFIFYNKNKTYEDSLPKTSVRVKIIEYASKAHLHVITPHGFRHTKATLLMSVCLSMSDVKAAAKFLGHSVSMMMETYAHEDKNAIEGLIKRLEKIEK